MANNHFNLIENRLYIGDEYSRRQLASGVLTNPPQSLAIIDCRFGARTPPLHASAFLHIPLECPLVIPAPPLLPRYDLLLYLPQAITFITQQLTIPNRNVLVHCASGRSRSVAVVCGYLIAEGRTLPQALALI
jgi:hypothetical protein